HHRDEEVRERAQGRHAEVRRLARAGDRGDEEGQARHAAGDAEAPERDRPGRALGNVRLLRHADLPDLPHGHTGRVELQPRRAREDERRRQRTRRDQGDRQLVGPAKRSPRLPLEVPDGRPWALRVVAKSGPYVISLRRPEHRALDLSAVVEKAYGARSTTRGWPTFERIAAAVRSLEAPARRARR